MASQLDTLFHTGFVDNVLAQYGPKGNTTVDPFPLPPPVPAMEALMGIASYYSQHARQRAFSQGLLPREFQVPEAARRFVAWINTAGAWDVRWVRVGNRVLIRDDYGDRNSEFGWEVDHIRPECQGGDNGLSNLRALHWQDNARHGGYLGNR